MDDIWLTMGSNKETIVFQPKLINGELKEPQGCD